MKKTLFLLLIVLLVHCKQRYEIPTNSPVTGYLVVEGHINSGGGPTTFVLSRTVKLSGSRNNVTELNAHVQVEDQNNIVFPLLDKGKGLYSADALNFNPAQKYRLRIRTAAGKDYLSDFVELKKTPPIDSINWKWEGDGVHIYVNAHDDLNNTRYYLWNYEETWEYNSAFPTSLKYENGKVLPRTTEEQIYKCWSGQLSTNILISSTVKFTKDIVNLNPLLNLPTGSRKLSVLYSILIKQYGVSKEAYSFLENMKKNTESLGSIFDAQPSELKGNIHAVNNPDEPVIGFVTAGNVAEKRIFIKRSELPGWPYTFACADPDTLVFNNPVSIRNFYVIGNYVPISEEFGLFGLIGWNSNVIGCIDCRQLGGTTVKPAFWP